MTTRTVRTCDNCAKQSAYPERWSVLETPTPTGPRVEDICLDCVARMRGWQNPYVAGTGQRVREFNRIVKVKAS